MRELTFIGYLKSYLKELTGSDTQSLTKLGKLAFRNYPRATEPVFLLAVLQQKTPALLRAVAGTYLEDEYGNLTKLFASPNGLMMALLNEDKRLPVRYRKVYQSYRSKKMRVETNRNASLLMREKTLTLMKRKGLSKYRIYTDLSLNAGNINAFLKNGDTTKVSRQTARMILDYVQSA